MRADESQLRSAARDGSYMIGQMNHTKVGDSRSRRTPYESLVCSRRIREVPARLMANGDARRILQQTCQAYDYHNYTFYTAVEISNQTFETQTAQR